MPSHVTLSSERTDWQTPRPVLDLVRAVRPILIDPASAPDNPTGATFYAARGPIPSLVPIPGLCVAGCGLSHAWHLIALEAREIPGLAFWNPPYGAHLSGPIEPDYRIVRKGVHIGTGRGWAAKYALEARAGLESIALVPVRTDAEWWHAMADASSCYLFWRSPTLGARISFVDPRTGRAVQGSNLASTVFYSGPEPSRFAAVFSPHGRIAP